MKKPKKGAKNLKEGRISVNSRGVGYVDIGQKNDIRIHPNDMKTALHGDLVEIRVSSSTQKGKVNKILERARDSFAGVLYKKGEKLVFLPDSHRINIEILIPKNKSQGARNGDKVFAQMDPWTNVRKPPKGKIVKVFGKAGENNAEMHAIALNSGFDYELSEEIESEAQRIHNQGIRSVDYEGRRDFRKTLTFTIDPKDAKDFDDAISFKDIGGDMYEVGIHIADVSHFVAEDSAIDIEAKTRGTSVYLVDRTIPMLPEVLSNDLCSLKPNVDRLAMSAVFELDKRGKVHKAWYGESVIRSQKRFTYEEAMRTIEKEDKNLHQELFLLNKIAKNLTKERIKRGALSIEEEEVKFVLDESGKPIRVYKKVRTDANRLIEEFMLLANRKVAKKIAKSTRSIKAFIYRIHDEPNKEKMAELFYFLESLGFKVTREEGIIPKNQINKILKEIEGQSGSSTISRAIIRSMAKAVYSTQNIGHYGLSFEYYTHFTSPIRRYPDLMVHRILKKYLAGEKIGKKKLGEFQKLADSCSDREKDAVTAERESVKYKQVEYMSERIGQKFDGFINGVSEMGIFVEELVTKSEGLIRMSDLGDDYFSLNAKGLEVVGQNSGKRFRFGDKIKIKVSAVDLERKTIDYILV